MAGVYKNFFQKVWAGAWWKKIILLAGIFVTLTALLVVINPRVKNVLDKPPNTVLVKRVIDGDTVELENGEKVRYIGMDAPEKGDCFASEATEKNRELVEGKKVRLEKDVSERDSFGRLLRYVWRGETMINEKLVVEGYAQAVTYPPDVKYQEQLREAERKSREEGRGLWGPTCTKTPKSP